MVEIWVGSSFSLILRGSENKCFRYFHKERKTWILYTENAASFLKYLKAKRSQINSKNYLSTRDAHLHPFCGQQAAGRTRVKHLIVTSDKMLVMFRTVTSAPGFLQGPHRAAILQRWHYMEHGYLSNSYTKYHSPTSSPIFLSGVEEEVNKEWKTRKRAGQHQLPFPMLSG